MFIPPKSLRDKFTNDAKDFSKVRLHNAHLIVDSEIAEQLFGDANNVNLVYYSKQKSLMIAPEEDQLFKKLHKAKLYMLKNKSAKGDKSISLHEIIIDNELEDLNRNLDYECQNELRILHVHF